MAEKKSLIERIKEVMYDPTRIRNVATSSHVHHGKCVSPDTLIFTLNGVMSAKELFKFAEKNGKLIRKDETKEEIYDISKLGLITPSFSRDGIKLKKILYVWKLKNEDPLIEIELLDGRKVKVTPEHKFICIDIEKYSLIEKTAGELREGDNVLAPKKIFLMEFNLNKLKEIFMEKLGEDYGFIVYLDEGFREKLHKEIIKFGLEKAWKIVNSELSLDLFSHYIQKGIYRLRDYISLLKIFGYPQSFGYDKIKFLSYRKNIKRWRISNKLLLPKSEEEFLQLFYLVGLIFGDGNVNLTFDNENDLLIEKVFQICKNIFGIECKLRRYKNKYRIVYLPNDLTLKKFFKILFSHPLRRKSENIDLPNYFFNLPLIFISAFIRGYYDVAGYVQQKVCLVSASKNIIEKLQLLLLRFGIFSYIRKKKDYYYLNISNKINLENFNKEIGSLVTEKEEKLLTISKILQEEILILPVLKITQVEKVPEVYDFTVEETHNFLANGFFIHNTTLTDNLMAGAGMLAEEMAGKAMFTWFDEQERKRELTIYGANVSMVHEYEDKDYLINLVDTPGHVDFGGDVTRAMRAVDGTIVLVDAVEGIMPQTETVFRQALRERVKPVLFINKTDRMIKELRLNPQQMMERIEKIIKEVNILIMKYAEEKFANQWLVSVKNGSVAIGSAYRRWAISLPFMEKSGITFKEIIQLSSENRDDELAKIAPLHKVVLDMIIKHLPNPLEAIKYRLDKIWSGDLNSEVAKDMLNVNPNGRLAIIITKMFPDPHVGFVATGRIFSGKVYKGKDVYLLTSKKTQKIQQVAIFKGIQRIPVDEVPAGNIVALVGIPEAFTGETVCDANYIIEPFVEIKHIFEPVVTKSVEPKNPMDLTRMVELLKQIAREDPTLVVKINPETGEYLVSGMGELHLEAKVENKLKEMGLDVVMSPPIVVYRETIEKPSEIIEGKSPNKHNRLYFVVEPLEDSIYEAIVKGEIPEVDPRPKDIKLFEKISKYGIPYETAKKIVSIYNRNILIEETRGQLFVGEIIEMVKDAFKEVCEDGPLAREPLMKVKVRLVDCDLHEDSIHRGPGQIMPATKYAIRQAMLKAGTILMEPKQILRVDIPSEYISEVTREIENRRGSIIDMKEEYGATQIIAKIPVSETFGFDAKLKSITSGRGFYSLIENVFEKVPNDLRDSIVKGIRKRKGLPEEIPQPEI